MKKKTKVIIAALAVLLLAVTCVTVAFLMKDEKHGTLAADTGIETEIQDKEQDGKHADIEIKATSETTEASAKEKDKEQDKTTEASAVTEKPNVTEAPATAEKPHMTEKPHTTETPATT